MKRPPCLPMTLSASAIRATLSGRKIILHTPLEHSVTVRALVDIVNDAERDDHRRDAQQHLEGLVRATVPLGTLLWVREDVAIHWGKPYYTASVAPPLMAKYIFAREMLRGASRLTLEVHHSSAVLLSQISECEAIEAGYGADRHPLHALHEMARRSFAEKHGGASAPADFAMIRVGFTTLQENVDTVLASDRTPAVRS